MAATDDELRRDIQALRARLAALERERVEQAASANAAVAAAQDRVYWLDRWHLDLNAVMNRRGARRALACGRFALRVARRLRAASRRRTG